MPLAGVSGGKANGLCILLEEEAGVVEGGNMSCR